MRKEIRYDIKRITALFLVLAMILPMVLSTNVPVQAAVTISEEDEDERYADLIQDYSYKRKLAQYLYQKYEDLRELDTDGNQALSDGELEKNTKVTSIEIGGDFDRYPVGKNMVNFGAIGHITNLQTLVINGADEIRGYLNLPVTLTSLEIKNTTLNFPDSGNGTDGFFSESADNPFAGVGSCNFRKFVIDNCLIGDYYREHVIFSQTFPIKIKKSSNLQEFKINVEFDAEDLEMTIDAGSDYTFEGLKSGSFNINKIGSKGRITVSSGNSDSYFSKNYKTVYEPALDKWFKNYLLKETYADSNGDSFISESELEAITKLDIVYTDNNGNTVDAVHNFDDIEKLSNLQELKIDLAGGVRYLKSIKFPQTGKLKSVSITNTPTACSEGDFGDLPSLKTFEYYGNTSASITGDSNVYKTSIKINDAGMLSSVKLDHSNIKSLVLSNAGDKGKLSISAPYCSSLESIELQGNGYDLEYVNLEECGNLSKMGYKDSPETNKWTINCVPDSTGQSSFNITNCAKFATESADTILNFDITGEQSAAIIAYGVNNLSDAHKLTINRKNNSGNIYMYYDKDYSGKDTWLKTNYGSKSTEEGYSSQTASSTPSLAIFTTGGNHIRTSENTAGEEAYKRWVDNYDVVLNVGSTINESLANLEFYAEDTVGNRHIIRRVNYDAQSDISLELVGDSSTIKYNGTVDPVTYKNFEKIDGVHSGRVTINICKGSGDDKKVIGQQDIMVISDVRDVDLTIHHSESGTYEDPIHIEKNSGLLKLSGKLQWADENPLYVKEDVESVLWMFGEYSTRSNAWIDMSASTATGYGISVKDDYYEGEDPCKTNTRVFSFGGGMTSFKAIAQAPLNRDVYSHSS